MRYYGPVTVPATTPATATAVTAPARIWLSRMQRISNYSSAVDNLGVFAYLGYLPPNSVLGYLEGFCLANGGATIPAELAVMTSTLPGGNGMATLGLSILTTSTHFSPDLPAAAGFMIRNAVAFGVTLTDWTHCWAGYRQALTGATPGFVGLQYDNHSGLALQAIACPALTSTNLIWASPVTTTGPNSNGVAPDFRLRLI
jgi:hypothetical protein